LSRVTTKPTECVCDQHGFKPACAYAQSDQDPFYSLTNPITSSKTDSEQHGSWSDCADAEAGLDPCWTQTHYVGFAMVQLPSVDKNVLFDIKMQYICKITRNNEIQVWYTTLIGFIIHRKYVISCPLSGANLKHYFTKVAK
jgi:hypothetical protein